MTMQICAGPNNGWYLHRHTMEWVLYRRGRAQVRVAAEAWSDFRRANRGLVL